MAVYNLKLTTDQFWRLTLKEFNALAEHHKVNERWLNYRSAIIATVIAEVNRDEKKRYAPFEPKDFMPEED